MNNKKLFTGMIAVVLTTAVIVGFASCNKDDKEEVNPVEIGMSYLVNVQWVPSFGDEIHVLEFKKDGTYSYEDRNGIINGIYVVTESKLTNIEQRFLNVNSVYLYKMQVSGNTEFDQLYVYYDIHDASYQQIFVEFYLDNEIVERQDNKYIFQHLRLINVKDVGRVP